MKIFFLLFVLCLTTYGYTQTTREEVVERFEDWSKKKVITYSGVGNAEKIIKVSHYDRVGYDGCYVTPYSVDTYGNKVIYGNAYWGVVKVQSFKAGGAKEDETLLYP
jgi:hypothetical protein